MKKDSSYQKDKTQTYKHEYPLRCIFPVILNENLNVNHTVYVFYNIQNYDILQFSLGPCLYNSMPPTRLTCQICIT